eukprot:140067_1
MATEGTDKSEPPPAYQETAAIKDDGGQTDTNTTNKQQNEKAPNEPIPDGEGIFGSPLKRVITDTYITYHIYIGMVSNTPTTTCRTTSNSLFNIPSTNNNPPCIPPCIPS